MRIEWKHKEKHIFNFFLDFLIVLILTAYLKYGLFFLHVKISTFRLYQFMFKFKFQIVNAYFFKFHNSFWRYLKKCQSLSKQIMKSLVKKNGREYYPTKGA